MSETHRPRVLCVDDEPNVLDGFRRNLRGAFEIVTAAGSVEALMTLAKEPPFEVVLSDLQMPGVDGISLLRRVRQQWPDTVRVLLTGNADLATASAAVNEGSVFRFLTKPCQPDALGRALSDAAAQHRLMTSERFLLEQTLQGSIELLADVLALASPAAFGRGIRLKKVVVALLDAINARPRERWSIEVAALLAPIGSITLPPALAEKLQHGATLTKDELAMTAGLSGVTDRLLAHIPRLEGVREILSAAAGEPPPVQPGGGTAPDEAAPEDVLGIGRCVLGLALAFDTALGALGERDQARARVRKAWSNRVRPALLDALDECTRLREGATTEITLAALTVGMTLAEDVLTDRGVLLAKSGQDVTTGVLERIRNFAIGEGIRTPLRVYASHVS
jgi:CheY-like chemotaxis protein